MIQITNPKRFWLIIIVVLAIIFWLIWHAIWGAGSVLKTGEISVSPGTKAGTLWQDLVDQGYGDRTLPWKFYGWQDKANQKLQAGTYHIDKGESIKTAVKAFVSGDTSQTDFSITYPEGFTQVQIGARTAARGLGSEADFKAAAKPALYADQFPFLKNLPASRDLEGYLFPDTYRVFPNDKPQDVIQRMLGNFNQKITDDMVAQIKSQGRTLDQIIIMASIIEREVPRFSDMPIVASVFWNRYAAGAGLGSDATIHYILGNWDKVLTADDLQIDSPYNTRKYRDLPPGPIGNPGIQAIMAAINPAKTDYMYYLTAPDGHAVFAKTNAEQNANKVKYLK